MTRTTYPKSRASGVVWIGEVPENWQIRRLKEYGQLIGGAGFPIDEQGLVDEALPFYKVADLKEARDGRNMAESQHSISHDTAERLRASVVPPNAVVYAKIGAALLLNRRRITSVPCCIDNNMTAYVPDPQCLDTTWVFYWLSMLDLGEFVSPGAVPSLSEGYQGILPICAPALPEQQQIVAFLDWKTGQIDALIERKKELLDKLKEKRLAVITQAVTRGLNPAAPLRNSGIPWLGQVPAHWEVMRFGYRTNIQEGQVDPEDEPYSEMPLIAPNHIEPETGRVIDVTSARDQAAISGKYLVRKGDVVYSKIRPHLNKCALVDFDGLCSADMYPIRTELELTSSFLLYWMLAQPFLDYATESSMRVAMPKLNRETLSAAPLVIPPPSEQSEIVAHILSMTKEIDSMVEKVEAAIARLAEYRTALITAATTGKIDVRSVKIPLPVA